LVDKLRSFAQLCEFFIAGRSSGPATEVNLIASWDVPEWTPKVIGIALVKLQSQGTDVSPLAIEGYCYR